MSDHLLEYPYSALATGILDFQQFTAELSSLLKQAPALGEAAFEQVTTLYYQAKFDSVDYDRLCFLISALTGYSPQANNLSCTQDALSAAGAEAEAEAEATVIMAHQQTGTDSTVLFHPAAASAPHSQAEQPQARSQPSDFEATEIHLSASATESTESAERTEKEETTQITGSAEETLISEAHFEAQSATTQFQGIQHPKRPSTLDKLNDTPTKPNTLTALWRSKLLAAALLLTVLALLATLLVNMPSQQSPEEHPQHDIAHRAAHKIAPTPSTANGKETTAQLHDQMRRLYQAISEAARIENLEPSSSPDTALNLLNQMIQIRADDPLIRQARIAIAQAFLNKAKEAREEGLWDLAEQYVDKAIFIRNETALPGELPNSVE